MLLALQELEVFATKPPPPLYSSETTIRGGSARGGTLQSLSPPSPPPLSSPPPGLEEIARSWVAFWASFRCCNRGRGKNKLGPNLRLTTLSPPPPPSSGVAAVPYVAPKVSGALGSDGYMAMSGCYPTIPWHALRVKLICSIIELTLCCWLSVASAYSQFECFIVIVLWQ